MFEKIGDIVNQISNNNFYTEIIVAIVPIVLSVIVAFIFCINKSKIELAFKTSEQQTQHRIANIIVILFLMMLEFVSAFFNMTDIMFPWYLALFIICFAIMLLSGLIIFSSCNRKILEKACTFFDIALVMSPVFIFMFIMECLGEAYKQNRDFRDGIIVLFFGLIVCYLALSIVFRKSLKVGYAKAYYTENGKETFIYMAINEDYVITGIQKNMKDKSNELHITLIDKLEDKTIRPMQNENMETIERIHAHKEKKKNILKFKEIKTKKLDDEIEKQCEVARKIYETMERVGIQDTAEGFELIKEILINNEKYGVLSVIGEVIDDFWGNMFKGIGVAITFFLGLMSSLIVKGEKIDLIWIFVLLIMGFLIDTFGKLEGLKIEALTIRMLKNMSYDRYRFLIDFEKVNTNC